MLFRSGASEIALRYGRWRFDRDDAVHDNGGVTWTRHLGTANSTLSGTLGYSMIECRSCQGWLMAGLDLNTEFWTGDVGHVSGRPVTIGTGLRVSGGIARYLGAANARASTLALLVPVDASVPALRGSRVHGTFVTGIGIGSVASDRVAQGAALPILGWSVGWSPVSQLGLNFGFQRVLLAGTPSQIGFAVSWIFGTHGGIRP